jgi:uncharacterized protein YegL
MAGGLDAMARTAAKMVIDTLTEVDYVTIVKYSSQASAYKPTLVQATREAKTDLKTWIDDNIDASGTTNFRAAFEKAWEVVDATITSSNCNRIMLFLSDGVPNEWNKDDYAAIARKSASYSPPMHLLTYGLGEGADPTVLKGIACENAGIYYSVTTSTISDAMASYFNVLAPMLSPCKLRWTLYNDYYTGQELLGACLASFEKESANSATSCNGGLSGLGEKGDGRVPKLIGVGCVDMNLVVDLPTLRLHPESDEFWTDVESDMKSCPMVTLTEAQMQTLRAEAGGDSAMCGATEGDVDGEEEEEEFNVGAVIGPAGAVLFAFFVISTLIRRKIAMRARAASPPAAPLPAAVAYPNVPQPGQQVQMGAVPMCQGAVVAQPAGYPQAMAQPAGYPQAVAQPYGGAAGYGQQPVPMGQVIS